MSRLDMLDQSESVYGGAVWGLKFIATQFSTKSAFGSRRCREKCTFDPAFWSLATLTAPPLANYGKIDNNFLQHYDDDRKTVMMDSDMTGAC